MHQRKHFEGVNFTRKNLLVAAAVNLSAFVAHGQDLLNFTLNANSTGNYRQAPDATSFEGGTFGIQLRDGNFTWAGAPCEDPEFFRGTGRCAPGSTGFVSRGLENDPVLRGLGPYFTITSITPAALLNPFDAESAILAAAPPSLLPRPLLGFEDQSISVFFNLFTTLIRQYPITRYTFTRQYSAAERGRFDGEVVPGTYRYNFASLQNPTLPLVLELNQFPMLDGFRKVNNQKRGMRFLNVTYDDGFAVLDPFVLNELVWEGNAANLIAPTSDNLYFSIKRLADPTDPLSDPVQYNGTAATVPIFPPIETPASINPRVILPSALDTSFIIPPGFLLPGQTGIIDLEFAINRPTSTLVFETAVRRFRMPVKITNPFGGFILAALPPGVPAEEGEATFDYDGDGISNFSEWVFGSNPADDASLPLPSTVQVRTVSSDQKLLSLDSDAGSTSVLEYAAPKLTNPIPRLDYAIEFSEDMVTWTEITDGDPNWILVDGYDQIKVTSSPSNTSTGGFFRTKVKAAN